MDRFEAVLRQGRRVNREQMRELKQTGAREEVRRCLGVLAQQRDELASRCGGHGTSFPGGRLAVEHGFQDTILTPLLGRRGRTDDGEGL